MRNRKTLAYWALLFLPFSLSACSKNRVGSVPVVATVSNEDLRYQEEVRKVLLEAESRKSEIADVCTVKIDRYFLSVNQRLPAFSSEALSLRSKYHLVNYKIREYIALKSKKGARDNREANLFNREISLKFRSMVMSTEDLQGAIESALNCYLSGAIEVDHKSIYKINQILSGGNGFGQIDYKSVFDENEGLSHLIRQEIPQNDASGTVVRHNTDRIIRYIGVRIVVGLSEMLANQICFTSGCLALSPETFALSVLVGAGIDTLWSIVTQPEKKLSASLAKEIEGLRSTIVSGKTEFLGYGGMVRRINLLRNERLDAALKTLPKTQKATNS